MGIAICANKGLDSYSTCVLESVSDIYIYADDATTSIIIKSNALRWCIPSTNLFAMDDFDTNHDICGFRFISNGGSRLRCILHYVFSANTAYIYMYIYK